MAELMVTQGKRPSSKQSPSTATTAAEPGARQPAGSDSVGAESGPTDLRNLYSAILSCSRAQKRTLSSSDGRNGGSGQTSAEHHAAVVVSATLELRPADTVIASRQDLSVQVAAAAANERSRGSNSSGQGAGAGGDGGEARVMAAPESLQVLNYAVGMALAHKLEKKNNVVLAFAEADIPSLATSHEALKLSGKQKLPLVILLQNRWRDGSRGEDSALEDIKFLAKEYGFPGIIVDGEDAAAIWRVAQESIHRARLGSGPTLLECKSGSSGKEDPLQRLERAMRKRGSWNDEWRQQLESKTRKSGPNVAAGHGTNRE